MITRVSQEDKNGKIELRLDNLGQLIIDIEGEQKHTITINEDNTNILRLMLYDKYKSRKMPKSERSAQNKILWALARAQGKKKPDENTARYYECVEEEFKGYNEMEAEVEQLTKALDERLEEAVKQLGL